MALRLSTGLRNAMMRNQSYPSVLMVGTTISFGDGDGTGGRDTINDSGSGFVSAGFEVGQFITVAGSTSNNVSGVEILSVAAGVIEIAAASLTTEASGDTVIIGAGSAGGGMAELFRNCTIDIYSGSQPADADTAESGTKLCSITLSSGSFSSGSPTNGLNFVDGDSAGEIKKATDETWSGTGLASGTAGWARVYDNDYTTGASTSAIRMDGSVGTSGAQFIVSSTSISAGATTTVDTGTITQPAA